MGGDFDAFISYSRRASASLATDLQAAVEGFAKPWWKPRAVRVFRDDASMSANTALWSTIEHGLTQAEWLVLLASPAAAASAYVAKEVEWWRAHKGAGRILIVLEEGVDIVWDRAANDFDWTLTDSLPHALSHAYAEEPRWIDLRWYELEGSLTTADPRWPDRVADIAAAIRGVERDELIGESVRQRRRVRQVLTAGVAALSVMLVAALVAAYVAVGQSHEATRQRNVAVTQRDLATKNARVALGRQLAAQSVSLAPSDIETASLLAVQAYRTDDDAQTRAALFQMATASPQLVRSLPVGAEVATSAVTPDGVVVTGDVRGRVQRWRGARPELVGTMDHGVTSVAVSADGTVVAAADTAGITVWRNGSPTPVGGLPGATTVQVDAAGTLLAASGDLTTAIWSLDPTSPPRRVGRVPRLATQLDFGPAGLSGFAAGSASWFLIDPRSGRVVAQGHHDVDQTSSLAISADGRTFAALGGTTDYPVWSNGAGLDPRAFAANRVGHVDFAEGIGVALSADGRRLAAQSDGRLEVVAVQDPRAALQRPLVLDGAGAISGTNSNALSFGGNRWLVSATGDTALLWDLDQLYRFGHEVVADVPSGCEACGPQRIAVSPDGTQVLMGALAGTTVVLGLQDGRQTVLDDLSLGLMGGSWLDADHVIAWSSVRQALMLFDVAHGESSTVAPLTLDDSDRVLAIRGDGSTTGRASVLTASGQLIGFDLGTGRRTSDSAALATTLSDTDVALDGGIAPDRSSAFLAVSGYDDNGATEAVERLDVADDRVAAASRTADDAAYDEASRLLVFDGEQVTVLDASGRVEARTPARTDVFAGVSVDPSGDLAATGGSDGIVSLLDLRHQGTAFGTVVVPQQDNRSVVSAFTPDSRQLVTTIQPMESQHIRRGLVRTVSLEPDDWITAACALAGRDLTTADWARYGVGPAPDDLRCVQ